MLRPPFVRPFLVRVLVLAISTCWSFSSAQAAQFQYLQDSRAVHSVRRHCTDINTGTYYQCSAPHVLDFAPSAPFADFDVTAPAISQTSSLGTTQISVYEREFSERIWGNGPGSGYNDVSGDSTFDILFEVDERVEFELAYMIPGEIVNGFRNPVDFRLVGGGLGWSVTESTYYDQYPNFGAPLVGFLDPGVQYRFYSAAAAGGTEATMTLSIQAVPEPGTAILLGAGLLALGARRRRTRASMM